VRLDPVAPTPTVSRGRVGYLFAVALLRRADCQTWVWYGWGVPTPVFDLFHHLENVLLCPASVLQPARSGSCNIYRTELDGEYKAKLLDCGSGRESEARHRNHGSNPRGP
jgi:hypothetical protein